MVRKKKEITRKPQRNQSFILSGFELIYFERDHFSSFACFFFSFFVSVFLLVSIFIMWQQSSGLHLGMPRQFSCSRCFILCMQPKRQTCIFPWHPMPIPIRAPSTETHKNQCVPVHQQYIRSYAIEMITDTLTHAFNATFCMLEHISPSKSKKKTKS